MLRQKSIKKLIIHCSDTDDDAHLTAIDIHKMHLDFGWNGIGYHKVITRKGKVEDGRPEFWIGAHVYGHNETSLGVCLIGRNFFTKSQFSALEKILLKWKKKYPDAKIMGHCDATKTKKTCPNFDVRTWCIEKGIL